MSIDSNCYIVVVHVHALLSSNLEEASKQADALRAQARNLMIEAVADAHQAGMTQREIAAKLNRSQPEVSRLLALAEPRFRPTSPLGRHLVAHRGELLSALESRGATNVRVFGSVARGDDTEESDIDLLVDIPSRFGLFALGGLAHTATTILGRKTDVIPSRNLRSEVRGSAMRDAVAL